MVREGFRPPLEGRGPAKTSHGFRNLPAHGLPASPFADSFHQRKSIPPLDGAGGATNLKCPDNKIGSLWFPKSSLEVIPI